MADVFFRGGHEALRDGSLVDGCDLRLALVMTNFTGETEEDSVNVADLTDLDEENGVGYGRRDVSGSVTVQYDATGNILLIDADNGVFTTAGVMAPGDRDFYGVVGILHVDGTDANDILVFFKGGLTGNANNGEVTHDIDAGGLVRVGISP